MIQNDDAGQASALAFGTATNSVTENSGRNAHSQTPGVAATAQSRSSTPQPAAALAGSDYTATAGTLNWADGDAGQDVYRPHHQ